MKRFYVYILECSDNLLYTGVTNNITRRLLEHQTGKNLGCFTYLRRPVALKFFEEFNDINQAIYFEKKLKKWSNKKKKALIEGNYDLLPLLAECKNSSHFKNKDKQ